MSSVVDGHIHHFVDHLGRRCGDRHRHVDHVLLIVGDGVVVRPHQGDMQAPRLHFKHQAADK